MANRKTTKRALVLSIISMLICVTMLVGTTFAWFTDEVVSGRNVIAAGNLDVELYHSNAKVTDDDVKGDTELFVEEDGTAFLWEPGAVVWENFTVKNVGTLALKYQLTLTKYSEVKTPAGKSLEDVIKVGYVEDGVTGADRAAVLAEVGGEWGKISDIADAGNLDAGKSETLGVVLYWEPTDVDNDYNMNNENQDTDLKIEFGVTLVATQDTVEVDSFDKNYDKDAEYPVVVNTVDELKTALAEGDNVKLASDLTVNSTLNVATGKEVTLDLNGKDISYAVSNSGASAIINNKGTLEIKGEGTISFVAENPDMQAIPSYATNTITNTGNLTIGEGVVVTNGSNGGASYAVDVQAGTFILDGGTLKGERCALRVAKFNQDDVKFIMNSGLVEAATPAWIHLPGSDSSFAPKITVTINGGTFKTTKAASADNDVLYTYSFGNSYANTSLTINGGEFLGGTVSIGSGYYADAPALTINGGEFDYDVLKWDDDSTYSVVKAAN